MGTYSSNRDDRSSTTKPPLHIHLFKQPHWEARIGFISTMYRGRSKTKLSMAIRWHDDVDPEMGDPEKYTRWLNSAITMVKRHLGAVADTRTSARSTISVHVCATYSSSVEQSTALNELNLSCKVTLHGKWQGNKTPIRVLQGVVNHDLHCIPLSRQLCKHARRAVPRNTATVESNCYDYS